MGWGVVVGGVEDWRKGGRCEVMDWLGAVDEEGRGRAVDGAQRACARDGGCDDPCEPSE